MDFYQFDLIFVSEHEGYYRLEELTKKLFWEGTFFRKFEHIFEDVFVLVVEETVRVTVPGESLADAKIKQVGVREGENGNKIGTVGCSTWICSAELGGSGHPWI